MRKLICRLMFISIATSAASLFGAPAATQPAAADSAEAMIAEFESLKPPRFDGERRNDQKYIQKYFADRDAMMVKRAKLGQKFVDKYPDHPKAPEILFFTAENADDQEKSLLVHRKLVEKYPDSKPAQISRTYLRKADDIGKPFELSFTDAIGGKPVSMDALKGKVVVVDFWATWCGPCVGEMPHMKELYAKYKDKGVDFIGVSLDQPGDGLDKLKAFVKENEITWPQYYQGKGWESEFSRGWGINGIPCLFIIDADGKLHSTNARGKLDKMIPALVAKRDSKSTAAAK